MKTDINELITLNYELEGLLLLALHRGDDTPAHVWQIIDSHVKAIAAGVALEMTSDDEPTAETAEAVDTVEAVEQPAAPVAEDATAVQPDEVPQPEEISDTDVEPDTADDESDVAIEHDDDEVDEPSEPEEEAEEDEHGDDEEAFSDDDNAVEEELTLDEKLARANSRCLKKAFSLNDRFRFRRELFGNSDATFTDTLDLVEAMRSLDEAKEYFFDELEWDPENQEVKDFMDVITKHFLSR